MYYCLDCKEWTDNDGAALTDECTCPFCEGNRMLDPIVERNEWLDRIDVMKSDMEGMQYYIDNVIAGTPVKRLDGIELRSNIMIPKDVLFAHPETIAKLEKEEE